MSCTCRIRGNSIVICDSCKKRNAKEKKEIDYHLAEAAGNHPFGTLRSWFQ